MRRAVGVRELFLVALFACGPDSAESPGASRPDFTVADSAGVEIVTNGVALEALPEWSLSAEPTVVIGDSESGRDQLYRVGGAATLPDGAIALLNRSSQEILVFEPDGSFRVALGGEGEGPGEFERPWDMLWRDGALYVWDEGAGRVTAMDPTGSVRSTATIRSDAGYVPNYLELVTLLDDGSFIFQKDRPVAPDVFTPVDMAFYRYGSDGGLVDTLPDFINAVEGTVALASVEGLTIQTERYGPVSTWAATPGGYLLASGRRHEVEVRSGTGDLWRVVRWNGPELRPTAADREAIRSIEDSIIGEFPRTRASFAQWPVADSLPAYDAVTSDAGGGFWVRLYRRPWEPGPRSWVAFDANGRQIARIVLPSATDLLEVTPSHVLLLHTDDLGVERILRYELRRLSEGGG